MPQATNTQTLNNNLSDSDVIDAITKALPDAIVTLKRTDCSKRSYNITVKSSRFKGKSLLEQHKMVNQSLSELLHSERLHAITLETLCE